MKQISFSKSLFIAFLIILYLMEICGTIWAHRFELLPHYFSDLEKIYIKNFCSEEEHSSSHHRESCVICAILGTFYTALNLIVALNNRHNFHAYFSFIKNCIFHSFTPYAIPIRGPPCS